MYKIAISGKANSGKNTVANIINHNLAYGFASKTLAFADPIKEIIRTTFPFLKRKYLYGSSKYRDTIINGALDSDGNPLTIRRALLDIGTRHREYNNYVWINVLDDRVKKAIKMGVEKVIVTDVRFREEFDHLKNNGFFLIRVVRDSSSDKQINHSSETNQEQIKDSEFDFLLANDSSLQALSDTIVNQVCLSIKNTQK